MSPSDGAAELRRIIDMAEKVKPSLLIQSGDLPATARELRDLLVADGNLYDRGMPVKLIQPAGGGAMAATRLTVNSVVIEAHRVCQPAKLNEEGEEYPVSLPERVARMYLDMLGRVEPAAARRYQHGAVAGARWHYSRRGRV
jgi:hypothetical protein